MLDKKNDNAGDLKKFTKTGRFLVAQEGLASLLLNISCSEFLTISTIEMYLLCISSFYTVETS